MTLYTDPIDTHGHTVADAISLYGSEMALGTGVELATSAAADDIIDTATAHGFVAGTPIVFSAKTGGTGGPVVGTQYYVIAANLADTTFQFATAPGGSAVTWSASDITAGTVHALQPAASQGDLTPASGDVMLAQTAAEVNAQLG